MNSRVEQLDGLRGVFSIMVVAHHHNAFPDSIFYDNFFVINSALFVDFFFILSGYVIAKNYDGKINSPGDLLSFIKKRFIRLYPLLFYTEIILLISHLFGDEIGFKHFGPLGYEYYLRTLADTFTFMGSTPVFGGWIGLNYPSWSISSEMISYLVYGLVIFFGLRYQYAAFVTIAVFSAAFIVYKGEYLLAYDFGFVRGLLCFTMGIFVNKYLTNKKPQLSKYEFPFVIVLLLAMYLTYQLDLNLWQLIFPPLFAVGIIIFASSKGILTRLLVTPFFQFLGKISYSIYLNHAFVLILVNVLLFRIIKLPVSEPFILFSLLCSVALTILYSAFTFKWIEKGLGNWLKRAIS